MWYRVLLGGALAALATLAVAGWLLLRPARVTIDVDETFQTIDGWEGTIALSGKPGDPANDVGYDALLDALVDQVGINRVRLEIRPGAESDGSVARDFFAGRISGDAWEEATNLVTNDNDDPFDINWDGFDFAEIDYNVERTVLPLRERLEARGERLIVNMCYVGFVSGPYPHKDPEEYAEFVLAAYRYLDETYGFVPDLWEVTLEPDLLAHSWTGAEMGAAIVAAARRLREAGYEPAFVAPSVTDMDNAVPYLNEIAAVPGAIEDVVEFSFHPYRSRSVRNLRRIAEAGREYGLPTAMLEWWFGLATREVLYQDLAFGEVSTWQGRALPGYVTRTGGTEADPTYGPNAETRYNAALFTNVRRGAVRVGAHALNPLVRPLAFVNPDGTTTVVVLTRWGSSARIDGLPAGTYRVSYVTEDDAAELAAGQEVAEGGSVEASIPAAGLILVTSRPAEAAPSGG